MAVFGGKPAGVLTGFHTDDYITDSVAGVNRWNKVLEKAGIPTRLSVPHKAFHRNIGALAGVKVSPDGRILSDAEWHVKADSWLPSSQDRAFVADGVYAYLRYPSGITDVLGDDVVHREAGVARQRYLDAWQRDDQSVLADLEQQWNFTGANLPQMPLRIVLGVDGQTIARLERRV